MHRYFAFAVNLHVKVEALVLAPKDGRTEKKSLAIIARSRRRLGRAVK